MSNVDVRTGNVVPADFIANESDARLIAAAPDLLAVAKAAYDVLSDDEAYNPLVGELAAAIEKADGGAHAHGGLADLLEDEARRETGR